MRKLDLKGFAATEVVLLVVVLALIGVVGYFVYSTQTKTTDE
jgi:uncharacterized protein (UPF0333 family)